MSILQDSLQSSPVRIFDTPEIQSISTEFVYNFFVPDERVDESGSSRLNGSIPEEFRRQGNPNFRSINANFARYVNISFNYGDVTTLFGAENADMTLNKEDILTALLEGKVVSETNMASRMYTALTIGNQGFDDEMNNVMRLALNPIFESQPVGITPNNAIDDLSSKTAISPDTLAKMLPPTINDVLGENEASHSPLTEQEPGLADVKTKIQLNKAFAPMVFRKSVERGTSLLNGTVNSQFVESLAQTVNTPSLRRNIGKVPAFSPHDLSLSSKYYKPLERVDTFQPPRAAVVGVVIEKKRIYKGKKYRMPTIVIADPTPAVALDTQVAYGQTYEYVARTLSLFQLIATDIEGRMYLATYLVASEPSQPVQSVAVETRAPSPPSDIRFFYNYTSGGLNIFWNPPVNPQRDVKYYQVFRRKNFDHPFELIHMIDFDDSVVRSLPKEEIDPSLVRSYRYPVLQYCDKEYTKDSEFIYAVVAVDARMQSSPYSAQIYVSFDQHENDIKLKLACAEGAPKQYPNWTKEESFFQDVMKDSGHEKVKIYFDPEVYNFIDEKGVSHPLFLGSTEDRMAKYVFQFINTDRLSESRFEVKIDNTAYAEQVSQPSAEQIAAVAEYAAARVAQTTFSGNALTGVGTQVNTPGRQSLNTPQNGSKLFSG